MCFFYPIKETVSEIGSLKLYRTFGVLPFEILLRISPAALNGIICYSSCFFVFLFFFSAATVSPQKEEVVTYAHFGGWRQHRQCQLHIHLRVLKTKLDFFFFFFPLWDSIHTNLTEEMESVPLYYTECCIQTPCLFCFVFL